MTPTPPRTAPAGAVTVTVNFVQPVVTSEVPVRPSLSATYEPSAWVHLIHAISGRPTVVAGTFTMPVYVCPAVTDTKPEFEYQPAPVVVNASECVPSSACAVLLAALARSVQGPHPPIVPLSNDASSADRRLTGAWSGWPG